MSNFQSLQSAAQMEVETMTVRITAAAHGVKGDARIIGTVETMDGRVLVVTLTGDSVRFGRSFPTYYARTLCRDDRGFSSPNRGLALSMSYRDGISPSQMAPILAVLRAEGF